MKKIVIIFVSLFSAIACKDITDLNTSPKLVENAPAPTLFSNAQKTLVDNLASTNVNVNIFRMLAQQWTETTYTDEANYDIKGRDIDQTWWHSMYRDVLNNLKESKILIGEDPALSAGEITAQSAIIEVLEVYTWFNLVITFGDMPYSEALDTSKPTPIFDDAATIQSDLMTKIDEAISNLSGSVSGGFANGDLMYGGDTGAWKMFANSLKLKMAMQIADVDPTTAGSAAAAAVASGVFTSNADNAILYYLGATPNTNPLWVSLVQSGRKDFVAANTLVDAMMAKNDPRMSAYFTVDANGGYSGGPYGDNNNYSTYSKPGTFATTPTTPQLLMDYSEVEFYMAEAVERGFAGISGTAESHYNSAITASMEYWGVDAGDMATYMAQPEVAYATASGTYKEKIGTQAWLAFYNRGHLAWTEWRRLDFPTLTAPPDAVSGIPVRYTYPASEQNLNENNYDSAAAKIGGDDVETKLFWDVN